MLRFGMILHPTDFSETSRYALHIAHSLAKQHQGRLVLLAVPPPPPPTEERYLMSEQFEGIIESTRRQLRELADNLNDPSVETRVAMGAPATTIVELAQTLPADLIVMGTHGRTGIMRLLMGSVAEEVCRRAPCLVLTIRAPSHEQESQDKNPAI